MLITNHKGLQSSNQYNLPYCRIHCYIPVPTPCVCQLSFLFIMQRHYVNPPICRTYPEQSTCYPIKIHTPNISIFQKNFNTGAIKVCSGYTAAVSEVYFHFRFVSCHPVILFKSRNNDSFTMS